MTRAVSMPLLRLPRLLEVPLRWCADRRRNGSTFRLSRRPFGWTRANTCGLRLGRLTDLGGCREVLCQSHGQFVNRFLGERIQSADLATLLFRAHVMPCVGLETFRVEHFP